MLERSLNYIDIHAHLNFSAYDEDREKVINRARELGVGVINVGTQKDTSKQAVELAEKNENMWAIVGLHPIHTAKSFHDQKELGKGGEDFTSRGEIFDIDYYRELLSHPKVVGVGECGLDYFRVENDTYEIQEKAFLEQIKLANEFNKPLMLHTRSSKEKNVYPDIIDILKRSNNKVSGDVHFFAGDTETAKKFLDLGFKLSFTGVITFAKEYHEVIEYLSLDDILSETDSPFVSPEPLRGKRNEPSNVIEVVKKIAEIKDKSFEEVRERLLENARKLFSI